MFVRVSICYKEYRAERTISAVFKEETQVNDAIQRLLERGVPREHISVMGRNFQSKTRIAGFIYKKDVILGGLRTGAVFGSLFGSLLSLLTGVGVLFITFVGSVVDRYNAIFDETGDELKAEAAAWERIHQEYEEDEQGFWSRSKVATYGIGHRALGNPSLPLSPCPLVPLSPCSPINFEF